MLMKGKTHSSGNSPCFAADRWRYWKGYGGQIIAHDEADLGGVGQWGLSVGGGSHSDPAALRRI